MKKTVLSILMLIVFLSSYSCKSEGDNKQSNNDSIQTNSRNNVGTQSYSSFSLGTFNENVAKNLPHTGEIVYGETWQDKNGENTLLLCEKTSEKYTDCCNEKTKELHAYHYANSGNGDKLIREIKDYENDCIFDMRARFVEESVNITDIDDDGYAEITFVYRLGCTSELSSDGLKLMMLENGEKYAIRGTTTVDYGYEVLKGETQIDPSFDNAPAGFLDFAKKIWNEQIVHEVINNIPRQFELKKLAKFQKASFIGAEPFWDLKIYDDYFILTPNVGVDDIKYNITGVYFIGDGFRLDGEKPEGGAYSLSTVFVSKEECSDGMSDVNYEYKIRVNYYEGTTDVNLEGCGKF